MTDDEKIRRTLQSNSHRSGKAWSNLRRKRQIGFTSQILTKKSEHYYIRCNVNMTVNLDSEIIPCHSIVEPTYTAWPALIYIKLCQLYKVYHILSIILRLCKLYFGDWPASVSGSTTVIVIHCLPSTCAKMKPLIEDIFWCDLGESLNVSLTASHQTLHWTNTKNSFPFAFILFRCSTPITWRHSAVTSVQVHVHLANSRLQTDEKWHFLKLQRPLKCTFTSTRCNSTHFNSAERNSLRLFDANTFTTGLRQPPSVALSLNKFTFPVELSCVVSTNTRYSDRPSRVITRFLFYFKAWPIS
jgi:hypothetical protein